MNALKFSHAQLKVFCHDVFVRVGFSSEEAGRITDVLLLADLYGIESHGVQRLMRYHSAIEKKSTRIDANAEIVFETPVSAVIDGHDGMGQLISYDATLLAIEKAKKSGISIVSVRNSNHFGIAGFYSKMAADQGMIGFAMTNSEPIMVPTHASRAVLGSNPIALAVPAHPIMFWFDAATTVVPRGKLEVYNKRGAPLADGWTVDENGEACSDASRVIDNISRRVGGGILPLGGLDEQSGSHKGYGFGMMCELFTAIFSAGATSNHHIRVPGKGAGSCHSFMVINPAIFGDPDELISRFSAFLQELRDTPPAKGSMQVYTHGEKEALAYEDRMKNGINVNIKTVTEMKEICASLQMDISKYFGDVDALIRPAT